MDNLYVSAGIVACIFLLAKFIEIRFISKSNGEESPDAKPMKNALRDSAIVFVSYILGHFIITQFNDPANIIISGKPDVFTGSPGF